MSLGLKSQFPGTHLGDYVRASHAVCDTSVWQEQRLQTGRRPLSPSRGAEKGLRLCGCVLSSPAREAGPALFFSVLCSAFVKDSIPPGTPLSGKLLRTPGASWRRGEERRGERGVGRVALKTHLGQRGSSQGA